MHIPMVTVLCFGFIKLFYDQMLLIWFAAAVTPFGGVTGASCGSGRSNYSVVGASNSSCSVRKRCRSVPWLQK